MKTKLIFTSMLVLALFQSTWAQEEKIGKALQAFLHTEFMQRFQDLKVEAENTAMAFKEMENQYAPMDRRRVAIAYDKTASRFNTVLDNIKKDFMDRRKLKYIQAYPDSYSKGLRADLHELTNFYAQNFQQVLADVTNDQLDGSPLFLLVMELVKLSSGAVGYIVNLRKESRLYNENYLQRYLIQPYKLKSWREVGGGFNDYGGYEEYPNANNFNGGEEDIPMDDNFNGGEDPYNPQGGQGNFGEEESDFPYYNQASNENGNEDAESPFYGNDNPQPATKQGNTNYNNRPAAAKKRTPNQNRKQYYQRNNRQQSQPENKN